MAEDEKRNDPRPAPNPAWKPDYEAPRGTRELHEKAYRERAGMIGWLSMCICTWPLEIEPATLTGHSQFCPTDRSVVNEHARLRAAEAGGAK